MERGFSETTAVKTVEIIKSNESFTGGFSDGTISCTSDNEEDEMSGTALQAMVTKGEMSTGMREQAARRVVAAAAQTVPTIRGNVIGAFPVGSNRTIHLVIDGPRTRKHIETLVKQLQLNLELGVFDDDAAQTEQP